MPFAQNFRDIKPLLERLGNEEICGLGHSFEDAQKKLRLAEPGLSPREKEVAELIRQGFTNKQIVLTAAEGYSFMQNTANARDYVVQITRNKVTYRIDKSAEITEADGRSVLTFTLDKSYKRSDLQNVTLRFGA